MRNTAQKYLSSCSRAAAHLKVKSVAARVRGRRTCAQTPSPPLSHRFYTYIYKYKFIHTHTRTQTHISIYT